MKKYNRDYFKRIFTRQFKERQQIASFLFNLLVQQKPAIDKILDIGFGYGDFLSVASSWGIKTYGVDISGEALKLAKNFVPQSKLSQLDVSKQKLPFKNSYFDVVITFDVVEHISQTSLFFSEIYRVLAPGGVLFLITTPHNFLGQIINIVDRDDPTHINRKSIEYWREELLKYDFEIKNEKYVVLFGFPPSKYLRNTFRRFNLPVLTRPFFLPVKSLCTVLYLFAVKNSNS